MQTHRLKLNPRPGVHRMETADTCIVITRSEVVEPAVRVVLFAGVHVMIHSRTGTREEKTEGVVGVLVGDALHGIGQLAGRELAVIMIVRCQRTAFLAD